ncbi:MAG: glycosyltransferase family 2 protein [Gemmatimonadota bacterium]
MKVSVVVPVFRSEDCLAELAQRVDSVLSESHPSYELIFVDDRSPDGSWVTICELVDRSPSVTGIRLRKNVGQDNAIMAGLHHVDGDAVVIMDDDLQHDPKDIPALLAELQKGRDVVYARFSHKKQAFWKNFGSWFNGRIGTIVLGKPKHIYMSPFKAMTREVADEVIRYGGPFAYIDGLIFTVTDDIAQIDAEHQARFAGESNYNLVRSIGVWLKLATSFSVLPLRIATLTGMALSLVSFAMAAYFAFEALFLSRTPEGWPSLIVSVFFLGGVQLMGIGALGEYIGRMFITQNGRPQFTVRDIRRR